jgi:hypothetical protein
MEKLRIMAAMPQFSRLRIKQTAEKNLYRIREMAAAGENFLNLPRATN